MLNTARVMDPSRKMMELSVNNFYHWGVVVNNRSAIARAQYAMAMQCVLDDYDRAEKYYRQVRQLRFPETPRFTDQVCSFHVAFSVLCCE